MPKYLPNGSTDLDGLTFDSTRSHGIALDDGGRIVWSKDPTGPNPVEVLVWDIASSLVTVQGIDNTAALLRVSRFATASLPAAGTRGRLAFDTTINKLVVDNGTSWVLQSGGVNSINGLDGGITLAGTVNQIVITSNGVDTLTFSTPQNIHTGAAPTFAGLTLTGLTSGRIPFATTGGQLTDSANLTWDNTNKLLNGSGDRFAIFDGTQFDALQVGIARGTSGTPTTDKGGILQIFKTSGVISASGCVNASDPECGTAVQIEHRAPDATQAVQVAGLNVSASSASTVASPGGDVVAVFGRGKKTAGTGLANGGFFQGIQTSSSGFVTGAEISGTWAQGTDAPYSPSVFPQAVSLHIVANGDGNNVKQGVGIFVNSANPGTQLYQAGLWFNSGSVSDVTIDDRTNSVISYRAAGAHTTGIDLTTGTFSSKAIALSSADESDASIIWDPSGMVIEGFGQRIFPGSNNAGTVGTATRKWNAVYAETIDLGVSSSAVSQIIMRNASNANTATIKAGVTTSNYVLTLPVDDGNAGQCLQTDGSGVLGWGACSGAGGGDISGTLTATRIPFATGTSTISDDSALTWDNTAKQILIGAGTNPGYRVAVITGTTLGDGIHVEGNATNTTPMIHIKSTGAATVRSWGLRVDGADSGKFKIIDNDAATTRLSITTAGSVVGASFAATGATSFTAGIAASVAGSVVFNNSVNSNTVTVTTGTTSPSYVLTLPTSAGNSGQALVTDGNGTTSWATVGGGGGGGNISGTLTAGLVTYSTGAFSIATDSRLGWDSANGRFSVGGGGEAYTVSVQAVALVGDGIHLKGNAVNTGPMLHIKSTGAPTVRSWGLRTDGADSGKFKLIDNDAGLIRLTADISGNIGIGTSGPTERLEVSGGAILGTRDDGNYQLKIRRTVATPRTFGFAVTSSGQLAIDDVTAAARRITIGPDGFVGVNSISPSSQFTTVGTIESTTGGFKFPDGTTQITAGLTGSLTSGRPVFAIGATTVNTSSSWTWDVSNLGMTISKATLNALQALRLNSTISGDRTGLGSFPIPQMYGPAIGEVSFVNGLGINIQDTTTTAAPGSTNNGFSSHAIIARHDINAGFTGYGIGISSYMTTARNSTVGDPENNDTYGFLSFIRSINSVSVNTIAGYFQLTVEDDPSLFGLKAAANFVLSNHTNRQDGRIGINVSVGDATDTQAGSTNFTAGDAISIGYRAAAPPSTLAWTRLIGSVDTCPNGVEPCVGSQNRFVVDGNAATIINPPSGFGGQILQLKVNDVNRFSVDAAGVITTNKTGGANAYACFSAGGELFRSSTPCV